MIAPQAKNDKIDAWWFAASDRLPHGDGRRIVVGETHSVTGEIVLCQNALHASRHPFDALDYAPGPLLYRVQCWGDVVEVPYHWVRYQGDFVEVPGQLGARHREYIAMRDVSTMLRRYARQEALRVIRLWNAPDVVLRYLETGDEALRLAARTSTWIANQIGGWTGAGVYAWAATWAAVGSFAGITAEAAAKDAALAAANAVGKNADGSDAFAAFRKASRKRFGEMVDELFATSEEVQP